MAKLTDVAEGLLILEKYNPGSHNVSAEHDVICAGPTEEIVEDTRDDEGCVPMVDRTKARASWLLVSEFFRLDWCCRGLRDAFGGMPYLVGSCMERPDYRDVDVSLMLPDEQFEAMFPNQYALLFLNAAVSEWLSARTGLKIDFKFQDTTKANAEHKGPRNPLGVRGESYRDNPPK